MTATLRWLHVKLLEAADSALMEKIQRRLDLMSALACVTAGFSFGVSFLAMIEWFPPAYIIALVVIGLGILTPFLAYAAVRISKKVKSPRPFHGSSIPTPLYWAICDVLEQRGIPHCKKYFKEHPEHGTALVKLVEHLQGEILHDRENIIALVYLREENPTVTGAVLHGLVKNRGDMPAREYRTLLEIGDATSTPLIDGAL